MERIVWMLAAAVAIGWPTDSQAGYGNGYGGGSYRSYSYQTTHYPDGIVVDEDGGYSVPWQYREGRYGQGWYWNSWFYGNGPHGRGHYHHGWFLPAKPAPATAGKILPPPGTAGAPGAQAVEPMGPPATVPQPSREQPKPLVEPKPEPKPKAKPEEVPQQLDPKQIEALLKELQKAQEAAAKGKQ